MIIIIMGVSGSGKSTIAEILTKKLHLPYYDADAFHSDANIQKMKNGIALTDADRQSWLETLASKIAEWDKADGAILACSALKEKYRITLQSKAANAIHWVYLKADRSLIESRLITRKGHFMPKDLIPSQFATLSPPEYGLTIDADQTPKAIVAEIVNKLREKNGK